MEGKDSDLKINECTDEELESITSKKQKANIKKDDYKYKECKVINYNKYTKTLDILFDRFGIRIFDVENFSGSTAVVKYKGEIGKPDFNYKL